MSAIPGNSNSFSTSSLSLTGSTVTSQPKNSTLTQADFLQLMTAQLQAQDPTKPMDNSQFASELAQFSQLSTQQDIDTNLQNLSSTISSGIQSSQVLSSANLVGREVLVPSNTLTYAGTAASGGVNVPTAGDVVVAIKDSTGNTIRTIDLGNQPVGLSSFKWDGTDENGQPVASGTYSISANASAGNTGLTTYAAGSVSGVGYGGPDMGTYLQVDGLGGVPLSQIAQIN